MGGRQSNSTYQYTLTSDSSDALKAWAPKLAEAMKARSDVMTDVDSDQSENGVETFVTIDRDSASRMGVTPRAVDNALYNAFGQRQVATIYEDINQYAVILEWDRRFSQGPEALNDVYVPTIPAGRAAATSTSGAAVNPALRDASTGSALNTARYADDAAVGDLQRRPGRHPDLDQPPERRTGHDGLVQPGRRGLAQRRPGRHQAGRGRHRHADQCARQLPGQRPQRPGPEQAAAVPGRRRHRGDLHRAGHSLRKLRPPADRAVDPAGGRRRRDAGPAGLQDGVLGDRPDRGVPAAGHRQEERHPDHRLRPGGPAVARADARSRRCARPACCAFVRS
jgi:hypothetical protein